MKVRFAALVIGLSFAQGCAKEVIETPIYQKVPVTSRDIVVSANAAGTIEPILTVEVKSKASGEILAVRVETGDKVTPGQLLVKVDPRVPANALKQAEADHVVARAQLTNAEAQFKRSDELFKTQSITETEWEAANLSLANARAQLVRAERSAEDARIAFEDTDVRATIAGTIIEKAIEIGTVIQSATGNVSGGAVLLRMANLDTVQIRSLVDETDIGKIRPGMSVTINVDAYPNRPFRGRVLKIEPQATTTQNVTMFPVLARIANEDDLLKPGMSAEVEISIGRRENVLAVPNAALRTTRDVASAAQVLGLDPDAVNEQLAEARRAQQEGGPRMAANSGEGPQPAAQAGRETVSFAGREIPLPEGVTAAQVQGIMAKMRQAGGPSGLSAEEQQIMSKLRSAGGGFGGQGGGRGNAGGNRAGGSSNDFLFGGSYVVFVLKDGAPTPVSIRTGLTDLDYSEVLSGLTAADTVLTLPSASLLRSQQEFAERINRMTGGGGVPGMSRN